MSDQDKTPVEDTLKVAPEVVGDAPQDSDVVGALTPEEMAHLQELRQKGGQITMEIGNLELRKARLLGTMADIEGRGQGLLDAAAQRLGIPNGQPWQVLPDGRARVLKNVSQMPSQG
jgi:hypothetical protein